MKVPAVLDQLPPTERVPDVEVKTPSESVKFPVMLMAAVVAVMV